MATAEDRSGGKLRGTVQITGERDYVPKILTTEIAAGIEQHIADEITKGDGFFKVDHNGKELSLKLVRVHAEYLASMGPDSHFACVDMVSDEAEFYDIDFLMSGVAGDLRVTETMVHKLNGKPYYLWQETDEKVWRRVPVEGASKELLGVLEGEDRFELRYQAKLPLLEAAARCWIPLAQSDDFQKVEVREIRSELKYRRVMDTNYGNQILFFELKPEDGGKEIEIIYDVVRKEKGPYEGDAAEARLYLAPEKLVPTDGKIQEAALKATKGVVGELKRARAIYDEVSDSMRYQKFGEGWGQGDAVRACDSLMGNCTDYHAYFIGMARSVGIPARFAIGAAIPSERDDGGTDGYHCWAEFYAEGKWWPVDVSEGDKFSSLSAYYFGHHPANRLEFSKGRDLVVDPAPAAGTINFLAYPYLEVKGEPRGVYTLFLFRR